MRSLKISTKRIFGIIFLLTLARESSACPLCFQRDQGEEIDFRNSNQPKIINEKVKKYFPEAKKDSVSDPDANCVNPNDETCKKPDAKKESGAQKKNR